MSKGAVLAARQQSAASPGQISQLHKKRERGTTSVDLVDPRGLLAEAQQGLQ